MESVYLSVPASQHSSLRCGGVLEKVFAPLSMRELASFYEGNDCSSITIVGALTNTLVLSGGVSDAVIMTDNLRGVSVEGDIIKAAAGEKLAHVARVAKEYGLSGMENLSGIPGSVGGAVYGNAGSFGSVISDIFYGAEIFRLDTGETEFLSREEVAFGYRYSNLKEGQDLITKVYFRLFPSHISGIAAKMDEVRKKRQEMQTSRPSLGSVFKKVGEESAGWYIEKAGLKGYRYGGMEFSERHANFIVNRNGTPEDYLYLVGLAERKVYETFGVRLKREVKIIGEPRDS